MEFFKHERSIFNEKETFISTVLAMTLALGTAAVANAKTQETNVDLRWATCCGSPNIREEEDSPLVAHMDLGDGTCFVRKVRLYKCSNCGVKIHGEYFESYHTTGSAECRRL